MSVVSFYQVSL